MQRLFKMQKLISIIYLILLVICFIYALGFMTKYTDLSGFLLAVNLPITEFHDNELQHFNRIIFWFTILGVATIILHKFFELRTKICDKIALYVISASTIFPVLFSIISLVKIPGLINTYHSLDYSKMYLEDPRLNADYVYVFTDTTFILGIVLAIITLLTTITLLVLIYVNHKKYLNINEVGEQND